MKQQISALFLLLVFYSCKSIQVPAPVLDSKNLQAELSTLEPSTIQIATELALQPYLKEAENSLDLKFSGEEKQCEGISYKYNFEREPLYFEFKHNTISYRIDGRFDLSLSYCPSCHELFGEPSCVIPRLYASCGVGEPKRSVEIKYESKVSIGNDFKLNSQTKLENFRLIDPCKITVFQYNATETIEKEVRKSLIDLEKDIDKQLESAPVRQTVSEVWGSLQDSILVAPYGYFYLRPHTIGISNLRLENNGKRATFLTQIKANPVFSTHSLALPHVALPKNTPLQVQNEQSIIHLRSIALYDSINKILEREIGKQTIEITNKRSIQIDKVVLLGPQKERLVLAVDFSGTKRGRVFLIVTPYIDEQQHLKIKDVDYDIQTKSVLLHSAQWILDSKLKELMVSGFDIDLNPIMNETKVAIEQQMNGEISKGVWLTTVINSLTVHNLLLSEDHISIDLELIGHLKLKIK
jgi:hypothetical protein